MKFVLMAVDGYYAGVYRDKFDIERPRHVADIQMALVFDASLECGKVLVNPATPGDGLYEMKAITLS